MKKKFVDHNLVKMKGVSYERLDMNKLIKHQNENPLHFAVKSQIFHILRSMNHDVLTEFEIDGYGIGDVLDLSTRLTTQYEIETAVKSAKHRDKILKYARRGLDIIVVNTKHLPRDEYVRYRHLKDIIVVPD